MKGFYITTPIYYVNDRPHLGTAYATITADVLRRYHRFFQEPTFFLTGTDEHGQKVQQAAEKRGVPPQQHCDEMVGNFREEWKKLDINYDYFIRTTDQDHVKVVQECLQQLFDEGEIYSDTYEGWYSVSEEIFYTEKDLVNGKSPTGREVTKIQEKNYFFRMSKYRDRLIQYIQENPHFIQPDYRRNEVLGFLRQPLGDLCVSRPKSRLNWGIEIPFDNDYVTYVWFDALLNYCSAIGYRKSGQADSFEKWWHQIGATHLIGKDILTTHCVYWPTMLMALGIPLPKTVFATGWILNKDLGKMSKSEGDIVSATDLAEKFGLDELRYFLIRDVHMGNDAAFSIELVQNRINSELANNLGNLLSRSTNLIEKYFNAELPPIGKLSNSAQEIKTACLQLPIKIRAEIDSFRPSQALEHVVQTLNLANKYLEEKAPWKKAKEDLVEAGSDLAIAVEVLRVCGLVLYPVMPQKMDSLLNQIGVQERDSGKLEIWPAIKAGTSIKKASPLFPRLANLIV